jgi:hypothetical protein
MSVYPGIEARERADGTRCYRATIYDKRTHQRKRATFDLYGHLLAGAEDELCRLVDGFLSAAANKRAAPAPRWLSTVPSTPATPSSRGGSHGR